MKAIVLTFLIALPLSAYAQDQRQIACMQAFDEQLKGVGADMINVAGTFNYKTLLDRATQCVQSGKCIKVEVFMSISELMVDEQVIKLQREKLSFLKSYFAKNKEKFRTNNYCAIQATFPAVMEKMQSLNKTQLNRYNELIQDVLDGLPKA